MKRRALTQPPPPAPPGLDGYLCRIDLRPAVVQQLAAEIAELPAFGARFPMLVAFGADLRQLLSSPTYGPAGCNPT